MPITAVTVYFYVTVTKRINQYNNDNAEVSDNAQSVQSDLGGGANGHLGLVTTPEVYLALVPNATLYI